MLNDPEKAIFPGVDIPLKSREVYGPCGCWTCVSAVLNEQQDGWLSMPFIVCPECGNKRCPKATLHTHACTGSNAMSQPGSMYEDVGWCQHCDMDIVRATFGDLVRSAAEFGIPGPAIEPDAEEGERVWRHRTTGYAVCNDLQHYAEPESGRASE